MKAKSRLTKVPVVPQESPLKADELIDFLERSYKEVLGELQEIVYDTLPILLLLEETMIQAEEGTNDGLKLRCEGQEINYCSIYGAAAHLVKKLCEPLHDSWNKMDKESFGVEDEIKRYRAAKQKDLIESGVKLISTSRKFSKS